MTAHRGKLQKTVFKNKSHFYNVYRTVQFEFYQTQHFFRK